jgi:hypothetical protein
LFLEHIRYKSGLIVVCILLFSTGFIATSWFKMQRVFSGMQCTATLHFIETKSDMSWLEARGTYFLDTQSGIEGKTSYVGKVLYFDSSGQIEKTVPISRELNWKVKLNNFHLLTEITGVNRRVGDHSDDALIKDYIFPSYEVGQKNNSSLFILNGRVLANGPDDTPKIICQ